MRHSNAGTMRRMLRRGFWLPALAAALAIAACTPSAPPAAPTGSPDEALQGHSAWCGTNPPSGYCLIDDKR